MAENVIRRRFIFEAPDDCFYFGVVAGVGAPDVDGNEKNREGEHPETNRHAHVMG
jgi:hypothetical protein